MFLRKQHHHVTHAADAYAEMVSTFGHQLWRKPVSLTRFSRALMQNTLEHATKLLFPPRCIGCKDYLSDHTIPACATCLPTIYAIEGPICRCCGAPRPAQVGRTYAGIAQMCTRCNAAPPAFDRARSYWEYTGIVAETIQGIKYNEDLWRLHALAAMMRPWTLDHLQAQQRIYPKISLMAVPMHPRDLRKRGFNVPAMLLTEILRGTSYSQCHSLATKQLITAPQKGLSYEARIHNLHDAFHIRRNNRTEKPDAVVIFDDVMTTGATTSQLASALKTAGCKYVSVLTAARTIMR